MVVVEFNPTSDLNHWEVKITVLKFKEVTEWVSFCNLNIKIPLRKINIVLHKNPMLF